MDEVKSINTWRRKIGRSGNPSAVELLSVVKQFTAADLDFSTDNSLRTIVQATQGMVVNPIQIWAKIKWPDTGAAYPTNADEFFLGLQGALNTNMRVLGILPQSCFSTSFEDDYFPVMLRNDYLIHPTNREIETLEACSLRMHPGNYQEAVPGDRFNGGDFFLSFRVIYENLPIADFF